MTTAIPSIAVVVMPRQSYSKIVGCLAQLYLDNEIQFTLYLVNPGYPENYMQFVKLRAPSFKEVKVELSNPASYLNQAMEHVTEDYTIVMQNDVLFHREVLISLLSSLRPKDVSFTAPITEHVVGHEASNGDAEYLAQELGMIVEQDGKLLVNQPVPFKTQQIWHWHWNLFAAKTPALKEVLPLPNITVHEHYALAIRAFRANLRAVRSKGVVSWSEDTYVGRNDVSIYAQNVQRMNEAVKPSEDVELPDISAFVRLREDRLKTSTYH